jgi:hypothetical protein
MSVAVGTLGRNLLYGQPADSGANPLTAFVELKPNGSSLGGLCGPCGKVCFERTQREVGVAAGKGVPRKLWWILWRNSLNLER